MGEKKKVIPGKVLAGLGIVIIMVALGICFLGYRLLYSPDFINDKTVYVYIDRDTDFGELCRQLSDSANCTRVKDFIFLAEKLHYPENMRTGKYAVEPGMGHLELLNRFRRGQQTTVRISFNNVRFLDELAERLDEQLMLGKGEILASFLDPNYCRSQGFTTENIRSMMIPNTYEVYWNISAEAFLLRMKREYDAFWNEARLKKAKAIKLSPAEVSILASIVEEESAAVDEYPVIAGLYLNRLWKGMLLQADPTIKYAAGDFKLRRILDKHKEANSPYNTYIYAGLPPGPIRIPSIKALDGVLNYMQHRYIYMCAKEDFSGRHNFAVTLQEHNRNAARYHAELNRRRIR